MTGFSILLDLGLVVVTAFLLLVVSRPLRIPPILAYIASGLVLGPVTGLLGISEPMELFAELGIALLLFLVGLELSLSRIRDVGVTALRVGLLQVLLTTLFGAGLALALGFPRGDALLLGCVTAFSSTVVVVKLLDRTGDVTALHGRLAVAVLLVQDIVVALVLTALGGLATGSAERLSTLVPGLIRGGVGIIVLGAAAWTGVRWLLPSFLGWLARSGETLFIVALTWCFGLVLLAEAFHVSVELGAFVAGVGLAQLPYGRELERRVRPLVDFFLAIFFVALGAGMDLAVVPEIWLPALVISLFVLVVKPLLVALLLWPDFGPATGFRTGLSLGQISEFAFVIVALAAGAGMVDSPRFQELVTLVGLVTIGASAVLALRGRSLADAMALRLGLEPLNTAAPGPPSLSDHAVVVGMNTLGRELVRRLAEGGRAVVAVDTDPEKLAGLPAVRVFGNIDSPAVLVEAGVPRAGLVVSALRIEDVNALLTYRCNRLGVPVSVHAFEPFLADELLALGADHVIVSKLDGVAMLEAELRKRGGLG